MLFEKVVALGIGEELEGELLCAFCCEVLSEGVREGEGPGFVEVVVAGEGTGREISGVDAGTRESPVESGTWIDVLGCDGGGELVSFLKGGWLEADGVGGFFGSGGCIADVEGVFGDLEGSLLVGVEEDVSVFWSFCQKIFGGASREGSGAGAVEGERTGQLTINNV